MALLVGLAAICYIAFPVSKSVAGEGEKTSEQIYTDAMDAIEREDYRHALDLLELAELKEPKPRYIYRRIVVLEALGEYERALDLLVEQRGDLAGQPGVGDLTVLEHNLQEASRKQRTGEDGPGGSGVDVLGWSLVGSGAAASAGGVVLLLLAESEISQVRCSGIYPEAQRTDCDGVDAPAHLTRTEFDERLARADTQRVVGGGLLAAGVLVAGWGAWRLMSTEQPAAGRSPGPEAALRPDWSMVVSPAGDAQMSLIWTF